MGETVTWTGNPDANNVPEPVMKTTTNRFSKITQVVKPKSKGYITLEATTDDDGNPSKAIATYHPYENNLVSVDLKYTEKVVQTQMDTL